MNMFYLQQSVISSGAKRSREIAYIVAPLFLLLFLSTSLFGNTTAPNVELRPAHIIILQTDAQQLWGAYYFAVQNHTQAPQSFTTQIRIPEESVDFQAGEALENANLHIREDGLLEISKTYAPGMSLQAVQFQVPLQKSSQTRLTLRPAQDIAKLYFVSAQSTVLEFAAEGFQKGLPPMLAGSSFQGIEGTDFKAGAEVLLTITKVIGDRSGLISLAWMMGFVLLLLTAYGTYHSQHSSRPRQNS